MITKTDRQYFSMTGNIEYHDVELGTCRIY